MKRIQEYDPSLYPCIRVHVVEAGERSQNGAIKCEIGQNLKFNSESLATYFFKEWDPVLFDALLVAASIEFCDRVLRRAVHKWTRLFNVRIPVHQPDRWNGRSVYESLRDSIEFLTGDKWNFEFVSRKKKENRPSQYQLELGQKVSAVIPFSNGLDSHTVARLKEIELGNQLVRIRLKPDRNKPKKLVYSQPFTAVPYSVQPGDERFFESSARSRGFKFAMVSGLGAYLSKSDYVIVTESGQGALGPVLAPVGQIWEDYRSYPLYTDRMQNFLKALLNRNIQYNYPQIWQTKGETLREYITKCDDSQPSWVSTISCWQQSRQVSINGKARQCGICAACMLRRLSVHAAGLVEPKINYAWEDLTAESFELGVSSGFKKEKITSAMREYAIAGTLHLSQIANLIDSQENIQMLEMRASELSKSLNLTVDETKIKLNRFLQQHNYEWAQFLGSLGLKSFVAKWARQVK